MKQYQIGTNYQQKELGTSNIQTTNRNPQIGNPKKRKHTLESRIFVRWSPEMIKRNRRASPPSRRVEEIEKKNHRRVAWERGGSDIFFSVCLINFKTRVSETFCQLMNVISVTFSFWCYFGDKNFISAIIINNTFSFLINHSQDLSFSESTITNEIGYKFEFPYKAVATSSTPLNLLFKNDSSTTMTSLVSLLKLLIDWPNAIKRYRNLPLASV